MHVVYCLFIAFHPYYLARRAHKWFLYMVRSCVASVIMKPTTHIRRGNGGGQGERTWLETDPGRVFPVMYVCVIHLETWLYADASLCKKVSLSEGGDRKIKFLH